MWNTPEGERRLSGAEAALVKRSLAVIVDRLTFCAAGDEEDAWDSGVVLFDKLTADQQTAVLHQVAEHLLCETAGTLELTAVTESAAYAIFANVVEQIEIEIDTACGFLHRGHAFAPALPSHSAAGGTEWRQAVWDAYNETLGDGNAWAESKGPWLRLPSVEHDDADAWSAVVESLADRILWDRDFEMEDGFLDAAPDRASWVRSLMGIPDGYYRTIADDPNQPQSLSLLGSLRRTVHAK